MGKGIRNQYVVARRWRETYVQTMCEPRTKKTAQKLCDKLNEESSSPFTTYTLEKMLTTAKKVAYI